MNWNKIMLKFFRGIVKSQDGATAIEYGLILGLIAVAIIASLNSFAGGMTNMWGGVSNRVTTAIDAVEN